MHISIWMKTVFALILLKKKEVSLFLLFFLFSKAGLMTSPFEMM